MSRRARQSILHLQMGQEIIYLLLAVALVAALVLLARGGSPLGPHPSEPATAPTAVPAPPAPIRATVRDNADLPPIITLSEAQGYFFMLGSAEIGADFRAKLAREVVPRVVELGRRHRVDLIEVVGHTDEIPLRLDRRSNLDLTLLAYLHGAPGVPHLQAGDNVGLGMARAAAVARELIRDPRLRSYTILPLSGGQAITTDQSLADDRSVVDEEARRRIEIRMRRRP